MWGGVETREHKPEKAYLGDSEGNELMLHGTVSTTSFLLLSIIECVVIKLMSDCDEHE